MYLLDTNIFIIGRKTPAFYSGDVRAKKKIKKA